jgi:hypothetical protein
MGVLGGEHWQQEHGYNMDEARQNESERDIEAWESYSHDFRSILGNRSPGMSPMPEPSVSRGL